MKQAKDIKNLKKPEKKVRSQTRRLQELSFQDTESLIRELEAHRDELEKHNEELQRLQKELEDSRNKYSDLYDFAPIGYFTFDGNGLILDVNLTGAGLLGIKKQFLINRPFETFIEASDKDIFRAHRLDVLLKQTRQTCEIRLKCKDGKIFYAQLQSLPVKDPEGNLSCLRTALSDITKLMDTEESVRQSEEYFRLVTENSMDIITILEKDGTMRYESPSVERTLGFQREELTGANVFEFVHPDDKEEAMKIFSQAIENPGLSLSLEVRFKHKDGSWRILEVMGKNLLDNPAVAGIVVNSRDINKRKQSQEDLMQLAEELKRSNTDLQQFAYAASHDLQEPLRVVAGFVKLLGKRYKDKLDTKAEEFIDNAISGVKRMEILIKDLLAYSQIGTKGNAFKLTDCSFTLGNALANLQAAIEENKAEVTYDRLPTLMADATQLGSLFQNLISNAIKFRGNKKPKVHVSACLKENEWVFSVQDNGIGIDPKDAERIFIIFQRLHSREEYSGTGIGLAVCKRIVERHGGRIWVESQPGRGSTFYFTLINTAGLNQGP